MAANEYLMVLPVETHRISSDKVAIESAFREHLSMLQDSMPASMRKLTVLSPAMSASDYEQRSRYLAEISEQADNMRVVSLEPAGTGPVRYYLRHFIPSAVKIWKAVGEALLVHAGPSHIHRLSEFVAIVAAVIRKRPSVFVVDIDHRDSSAMNLATGRWSTRSYWLAKYLYDPLFSLQIRFACRYCSLVMLKGQGQVDYYGKGRPHVKNLLDPAHSTEHVIDDDEHAQKLVHLGDERAPLVLTYFGRLVAYKGIDRCIRIMKFLNEKAPGRFSLVIIGAGEQEDELKTLVNELSLSDHVTFTGALQFGPELFSAIRACDITLATPLEPDAPRSSLDAMCSGLPLLAFDIGYYKSLVEDSGAVRVVPWDDVSSAAEALLALDADRDALVRMSSSAVNFARTNTQEKWLEMRAEWTVQYCALEDQSR